MIVTLCGSGKLRDAVFETASLLRQRGYTVLVPPLHDIDRVVGKRGDECLDLAWKGATHAHFYRLRKADVVIVVNPTGYVGVSTTLELGYAAALGKLIVAMQPDSAEHARNILFDFVASAATVEAAVDEIARFIGR
jgi:nucleoside 2-deoxyribosyltransferase